MSTAIRLFVIWGFLPGLIGLLIPISMLAQRELPDTRIPSGVPVDTMKADEPDTLKLSWFTTDNINADIPFTDSLLDFKFIHYNPLFQSGAPHLYLGSPGSSNVPLTQFRNLRPGMHFGFQQFDPYKLHLENLKWFRTNLPFADLYFSPGKTQNELSTSAKFTMNLDDNWSMNIDYQRLLDNGYYKEQATKNSSLIFGLWHRSKNAKSNTFLTFLTNIHQEGNNGGITDTIFLSEQSIRSNIPVMLSSSTTRHQNEKFSVHNIYAFEKGETDPIGGKKATLQLSNSLSYEKGFFKFFDENTSSRNDSMIYKNIPPDPLGIRNYIDFHRIHYKPEVRFIFKDFGFINSGISYDFYRIGQNQLKKENLHDLTLDVTGEVNFIKFLTVNASADYHMLDFAGDLDIDISGTFHWEPYIHLTAGQRRVNAHPYLIQNQFLINNSVVYANDFGQQKQLVNTISLKIPWLGMGFSLSQNTFTNYIYYSKENHFQQYSGELEYLHAELDVEIKIRSFHLDSKLHYFRNQSEIYDMPDYRLASKLYFKGNILKNRMELFAGVESYITDGFYIPEYQPAIGIFTTKSDFLNGIHTLLDVFISFKVQDFRFFARTENLLYLLDQKVHYHTKFYPLDDFKAFRMGVKWQFVN